MPSAQEQLSETSWQQAMADAYVRPADLLQDLGLPHLGTDTAVTAFPMRVPRSYAARMVRGDPQDPLLLQVLPGRAELLAAPGFTADPVGDLPSIRTPGLLQKYAGRALIITTGACAVHCRYCFRRDFPYSEQLAGPKRLAALMETLREDTSITEVILSGGDPLSLTDDRLHHLLEGFDQLPQLSRIRIHTRTPIVLPERVNNSLIEVLQQIRKPLVTVLHCNHANEIDSQVRRATELLKQCSTSLLNQTVLLKGINDSASALVELSEKLFAAGVLPYYLHQLDPVAGAAHFAVSDSRARDSLREAATRLPGYLVPRLVREQAGAFAKTPL
ncbi:MAG: EF-P beta-lysylation protein EpmB [Gammaproteobacteria bacterium]